MVFVVPFSSQIDEALNMTWKIPIGEKFIDYYLRGEAPLLSI